MNFYQTTWVEIWFKKINHDYFKPAGMLELGHNIGLILTTILFGTGLNFHINHSFGTLWKEKINVLLDEIHSY